MTARQWVYVVGSAVALVVLVLSLVHTTKPMASVDMGVVATDSTREMPSSSDMLDTFALPKQDTAVLYSHITDNHALHSRLRKYRLLGGEGLGWKHEQGPVGSTGNKTSAATTRQQLRERLVDYAHTQLGHLASYIPNSMDYDAVTVVIARVEAGVKPQADLTQGLTMEPPAPGSVAVAPLTTSLQMEAHLIDPDSAFTIRILTKKPVQLVDDNGATEWSWAVTPIMSGEHPLRLTVDQVLQLGGEQTTKTITVGTRQVQVKTSPLSICKRWIRIHLPYILSAILLPSLAWIGKEFFQQWLANQEKSVLPP